MANAWCNVTTNKIPLFFPLVVTLSRLPSSGNDQLFCLCHFAFSGTTYHGIIQYADFWVWLPSFGISAFENPSFYGVYQLFVPFSFLFFWTTDRHFYFIIFFLSCLICFTLEKPWLKFFRWAHDQVFVGLKKFFFGRGDTLLH